VQAGEAVKQPETGIVPVALVLAPRIA